MARPRRIAAALFLSCSAVLAQAAELTLACGGVGQELALCKSAAQEWAKQNGHVVKVYEMPANASDRLGSYRWMLESKSPFLDVLQIDVVWAGMLAPHLLDLRPLARGTEKEHFPGIVASNMVGGRLVAMPWFTDAGLLYYRRDLLDKHGIQPPATWDELAASARRIQDAERAAGKRQMWGYVWQGRAYEGLTCNALEWIASHGGGNLLDAQGHPDVNNPQAAKALQMAAGWVGTISPPTITRAMEEEARKAFQEGNAVYMRNWPYAWSLLQSPQSPVKGKVGVTMLPRAAGPGGRHASTLGGQHLALSAYTRQPALAADLLLYLTSAKVQKDRALAGSFNPTRPELYRDAELLKATPWAKDLSQALQNGVARPSTPAGTAYERISNAFSLAVSQVLQGHARAEDSLRQFEATVPRLEAGTPGKP